PERSWSRFTRNTSVPDPAPAGAALAIIGVLARRAFRSYSSWSFCRTTCSRYSFLQEESVAVLMGASFRTPTGEEGGEGGYREFNREGLRTGGRFAARGPARSGPRSNRRGARRTGRPAAGSTRASGRSCRWLRRPFHAPRGSWETAPPRSPG